MGFFKNLILRSLATTGYVTGGAHRNCTVIINAEKGNPMATGLTFLDASNTFEFKKNDIAKITVAETNAKYSRGNSSYVGCRYNVTFSNGETSIVFIVANSTSQFETLMVE